MAYTLDQISKLESAIAQGALLVKYADKQVTYRSLSEMRSILSEMKKELGVSKERPAKRYIKFSKGISE